jgi:hypothetical protein
MRLQERIIEHVSRRTPDFVIGGREAPYLLRWFVIPRNRFFNIYLHRFLRSDNDRALHDHPWANCSYLLRGEYTEHTETGTEVLRAGAVRVRWSGTLAHRVELHNGECWTLFVTGPRYRNWGFHCEERWVPWEEFTARDDSGSIGKGCG